MERVPEPELMLGSEQALAYAAADFDEPHGRFIELLRDRLEALEPGGDALDVGCGPGDITFRFARAFPRWTVDGIDGSKAMLDLAYGRARREAVGSRIRFLEVRIPDVLLPRHAYDLVFSNALLHHLSDPAALWSTLMRCGRYGAHVFVMDLLRPPSPSDARGLVDRYAGSEPEVLRSDFYNSLRAAYRPDEVRDQLERAGLGRLALDVVSDRHLVVWGRL